MKLKIIFFPLALAFSVYFAIAFVWPEFVKIQQTQKDIAEKQKILDSVRQKKTNIVSLKKMLDENHEKAAFVESYYPREKQEERFVSEINNLAASSGVVLLDLSIKEQPKAPIAAVKKEDDAQSQNALFRKSNDGQSLTEETVRNPVQYSGVKISIAGDYDRVKIFLEKIYKIGLLNRINLVSIEKSVPKEETEKVAANTLSANLEVEFGHSPVLMVKKDATLPVFSKTGFDLALVEKVRSFIEQSASSLEVSPSGKANPFVF